MMVYLTHIPRRSIICTIINAITMALLDAGVAMIDLVVSCSVGRLHNQLHLDITQVDEIDFSSLHLIS